MATAHWPCMHACMAVSSDLIRACARGMNACSLASPAHCSPARQSPEYISLHATPLHASRLHAPACMPRPACTAPLPALTLKPSERKHSLCASTSALQYACSSPGTSMQTAASEAACHDRVQAKVACSCAKELRQSAPGLPRPGSHPTTTYDSGHMALSPTHATRQGVTGSPAAAHMSAQPCLRCSKAKGDSGWAVDARVCGACVCAPRSAMQVSLSFLVSGQVQQIFFGLPSGPIGAPAAVCVGAGVGVLLEAPMRERPSLLVLEGWWCKDKKTRKYLWIEYAR